MGRLTLESLAEFSKQELIELLLENEDVTTFIEREFRANPGELLGHKVILQFMDTRVGQNLKALRMASGRTQREMGELVGLGYQQIQKYERGENRTHVEELELFSQALDVPVSRFFAGLPDVSLSLFQEDEQEQSLGRELLSLFNQGADISAIAAKMRVPANVRDVEEYRVPRQRRAGRATGKKPALK